MKTFTFNADDFDDLSGFYEKVSDVLMKNQDWKIGTLDGFNDILYGGFGVFENDEEIEIVWKNSEKSRKDLGLKTTLDFLENKLKMPEIYNVQLISQQKENLLNGKGKTLFEILIEIMESHQNIQLKLK